MKDILDFEQLDSQRILLMKEETFLLFLNHYYDKIVREKKIEPEFVDEKTALEILHCGKTKLFQLRASGAIAYSQMGKKIILYRRSSLKQYILDHEHKKF